MKIEKIHANKIKIIFNYKELEENNISVHSFLSNSLESQKLFLAILDIANEDLGFDISNSKISYEAFSFDNKTFVIFVTKSVNTSKLQYAANFDTQINEKIPFDSREINGNSSSHFKFIGNSLTNLTKNLTSSILLYKFNNIEEVFSFCDFINNCNLSKQEIKSSLYKYNDLFLIKIYLENLNEKAKKSLTSEISEFKDNLNLSNLALIRLQEFSNLIIKNNAIQVL